ncbi:MAG: SDR family oxidoreductase [Spirochaetales bacterium]|nr:SDR family oxidoreductase [Spirochaetales bacterium]
MGYLETMFSFEGTTVVLTGGGGVIAGAMAEAFLRAGASVALWGIRMASLESARQQLLALPGLEDAGSRVRLVVADTANEDAVRAALETTADELGEPRVLVNGVGGNRGKSKFVDTDLEVFNEILSLNIMAGLVVPTKVLAARWIAKGAHGSIINMASMASYVPLSGVWAYGASKAAVMNLTMANAREFAPAGIRVNAIAPGFFIGKQNRALLIDEETGELTQRGKDVIAHTPYGRFGDVSELAGTTLFLASDAASGFITGVTIPVDGGYLVSNI